MKGYLKTILTVAALGAGTPALADASVGFERESAAELPAYLQCVPYARELSGIQIYGDAHTWWGQAEGRYERGNAPRVGAVMAFVPNGKMQLGHVAAVSKIVDRRTVLLDHANWSPIDGRRGQVERNVMAVDVSPNNDWSAVRVWYHPIQGLGTTEWPVHGFIYSKKARLAESRLAVAAGPAPRAISPKPSKAFTSAFAGLEKPTRVAARQATPYRAPVQARRIAAQPRRVVATQASTPAPRPRDAIDAALSRYD